MSNMVEIDIDFDYCGEVEMVLAHDECGEHDDVEFYRNDLLAADNAKLRALVRDMYMCAERECMCHGCPLRDDERCDFEGRMAALGVDADDINQSHSQSTKDLVDLTVAREVD